ncbi:ribonuclease H-like domain-containing protein [Tanacetum coccineum]
MAHSPIPTDPTTSTQHPSTRTHLMVIRAQVGTVKPNPCFNFHTSHISPLPKSPSIALSDPNWRIAMYDEYNALVKNNTWILVPKPPNANVVWSMWLFRHKYHADGSLSRYKARLVAIGRTQQVDNLLSWSAKRQHTLSRSSVEAEYRGVANVVAETVWLRNLLKEFHSPLLSAILVYCENVSAIYMSANPVQHQRTKHIEIDINFVRDMVARGQVRVLHVPSRYQYADIFTKGLPSAFFEEFHTSLIVRSPPAQTAREC